MHHLTTAFLCFIRTRQNGHKREGALRGGHGGGGERGGGGKGEHSSMRGREHYPARALHDRHESSGRGRRSPFLGCKVGDDTVHICLVPLFYFISSSIFYDIERQINSLSRRFWSPAPILLAGRPVVPSQEATAARLTYCWLKDNRCTLALGKYRRSPGPLSSSPLRAKTRTGGRGEPSSLASKDQRPFFLFFISFPSLSVTKGVGNR